MKINAATKRALEKAVAREAVPKRVKPRGNGGTAAHIAFGFAGEDMAADYLTELGYRIIARNARVGHCELDIIARDGDDLVFAEVRSRRENPVAAPEDTVGPAKLEKLTRAASLWAQRENYQGFCRIDLIAVTELHGGGFNLEHIKNITESVL